MPKPAPAVECEDLVVRYGQLVAVDHVSFDVAGGEIVGLLGPNGAGKTSVVRALTTILDPAGGTARIQGFDLSDAQAVRRCIGVLPESNGYPHAQTGFEYLVFHAELFGLGRRPAVDRARSLLAQLGLTGAAGARIGTYSRGMRQRLGICRALVNSPGVLFLDEPTLGLDPAGKEDMLAYLSRVARARGTSVVLCSHQLDDVERICDRVVVLHRGSVVTAGTVGEIVAEAGLEGGVAVAVPPRSSDMAAAVLARSPGVAAVEAVPNRLGELEVGLAAGGTPNHVARALLDSDLEIVSLQPRGVRLSEAFLKLTGASPDGIQEAA